AELDVELVALVDQPAELGELAPRLLARIDHREGAADGRQQQHEQHGRARDHATFSAMRRTALRARGLAVVSAAEAKRALPMARSGDATIGGAGSPRRTTGADSPRMNCLTM